ncbi:DEAD/DEAH box helicase [Acidocella facilis]|uniref:DEAD/DEAH box helicase n=1 Tax=Acidocella facilis TaxID=525 RepID=UPI001F23AE4F|nr:DEAD/DEAH box helicase [Acidocella facilis]
MTTPTSSNLAATVTTLTRRSASAVVARARAASPGFNDTLLRHLSVPPGKPGALLAEPVFEVARNWEPADRTLGELAGTLLHPDLVAALDAGDKFRMARTMHPYAHQLAAWRETLEKNRSILVTAGTGAGKTECFLLPILNDLLRETRPRQGVQAIIVYPLNALIESQRDRLEAWARALNGRVRFALFNGDTPEKPKDAQARSSAFELTSREDIRRNPPDILVTNITMLEYLMLRPADAAILQLSQGALRWVVLDEAHSFAGAQAAEMALLLRRVRAAFGVQAKDVRLVATSATIGGEDDSAVRLRRFLASLAGRNESDVTVIEGRAVSPALPPAGPDLSLAPADLAGHSDKARWTALAQHPRLQRLHAAMSVGAVSLSQAARILFDDPARLEEAQAVLDMAALATPKGADHLLPWRAHLFHHALGGVWVCIDPHCSERDPALAAAESGWRFGAIHIGARERCACTAPAFEVMLCDGCGAAHLAATQTGTTVFHLESLETAGGDDFALDDEPAETDGAAQPPIFAGKVWLSPAPARHSGPWIGREDRRVWDNPPDVAAVALHMAFSPEGRLCCGEADATALRPLRYGPAFFMSNGLPLLLEELEPAAAGPDKPNAGRRAISFSDSRQGVARLAAKLQRDAEITLTRSFLYHRVQQSDAMTTATQERIETLREQIGRMRAAQIDLSDMIQEFEVEIARLSGTGAGPVAWKDLINGFSAQSELQRFAGKVWQSRRLGAELADHPEQLAEMFLYRELLRRPRVQNNAETMGLLRLSFPALEVRARTQIPVPLQEAGIDENGWIGLLLTAIDGVFRNSLAVSLPRPGLMRLISPRPRGQGSIVAAETAGTGDDGWRRFPGPRPSGRPSRLHHTLYALLGGHWSNAADCVRAGEVLDAMWQLFSAMACVASREERQLDFSKAAVLRLDEAWVCPVTRRLIGYSIAGRSPYSFVDTTPLAQVPVMQRLAMPRPPQAQAGGLDIQAQREVAAWSAQDGQVATLRRLGVWTDLHDRIAAYASFLRAQEHSAQIDRPVLKTYVEQFEKRDINLLNCSTTMEMGVDIAAVRLVVNANVPPAIANYRQRAGRAGRRREAWAFTVTFARDLPLDRWAADDPQRYLAHPVVAPAVWLESAPLVQRHVNAALLASFLRARGGQPLRATIGEFLGAAETREENRQPQGAVDAFITAMRNALDPQLETELRALTRGTALEARTPVALAAQAAQRCEAWVQSWRAEYSGLLDSAAATGDQDARTALTLRAKRMRGEFMIGELARRGFTPSYGFPTDVVSFDYLSGRRDGSSSETVQAMGELRGAASRTLDIALREYAPGAELVIDGLVYRSEGIRLAWTAGADASRLEDFRRLWTCHNCGASGLERSAPQNCRQCQAPAPDTVAALIPAGFVSQGAPHTGYEVLESLPFEKPRILAEGGVWTALPDPVAGRWRCDPEGEVVTTNSGANRQGFAVCLACGRAASELASDGVQNTQLPVSLRQHTPLLPRGNDSFEAGWRPLTQDGRCPGGYTDIRMMSRRVHLAHSAHTDVFELQPAGDIGAPVALALAAGLREALAERLGVEAREIGVASAESRGRAGERCHSVLLFDRAAGGAGYVTRLTDPGTFAAVAEAATARLRCAEQCLHGCAACVLRPDLNLRDQPMDREAGLAAARRLCAALALPQALRLFGPESQALGQPALAWLVHAARAGRLSKLTLYLHGEPDSWDLSGWPADTVLAKLREAGGKATLAIASRMAASKNLDFPSRVALVRLCGQSDLAMLPQLPEQAGHAVIATLELNGALLALSACPSEALAGPDWGASTESPVVIGPWPVPPALTPLESSHLLTELKPGAKLLWISNELDGKLSAFGDAFWELLKAQAPAAFAAMAGGVEAVTYSDRYLITPLTLMLLRQVLKAMPSGGKASVRINLAPADRPSRHPVTLHDSWLDDGLRRDVLRQLVPHAWVEMAARKAELAHHRGLRLRLRDGDSVTILLDQGFGAWTSASTRLHDFRATAPIQASALAALDIDIRRSTLMRCPVTVEVS